MGDQLKQQKVRREREEKEQELFDMQRKSREVGDKTAERMADKFRKQRETVLVQKCVMAWATWLQQEAAHRQKIEELEALKSAQREAGDATAELLETCLEEWNRCMKEEHIKNERDKKEKELLEMQRKNREAG